jgi:hypothetical protein
MANPILESLLAPYQRAIKGTPTTRGSIADDPLLSLLLPRLQAQGRGSGGGGGGGPLPPALSGAIDELLWRTDDHYDHLHFGSSSLPMKKLARQLAKRGFTIGDLEGYGGTGQVSSGHVENSMHYSGNAMDVNYYGGGRWKSEPQALDWLYKFLQRRYG